MYRLTFLKGPLRGRRLTVREGSVRVGRGADCDIQVASPDFAERHFALEDREGRILLRVLDAERPVTIDGERVTERDLHPGDRIQVGRTVIGFLSMQPARRRAAGRVGKLQVLAYVAVALIVLLELGLVIGFTVLKEEPIAPPPAPPPPAAREPAPETPVPPVPLPAPEPPAPEPVPAGEAPATTNVPADVLPPEPPPPAPAPPVAVLPDAPAPEPPPAPGESVPDAPAFPRPTPGAAP